ncbi:MAG TPA: PRTRC system protein C [Terracidiphilus sp.]|nr:PRTRC system protein C [Terracidiphilus sp.]HEV2398545.1 PRTRC system protein C [Candidatus Sulfotelmatobacter sp.]
MVKNHHAGGNTPQYPEVATASVSGPEVVGASLRYTFTRAIGTKG